MAENDTPKTATPAASAVPAAEPPAGAAAAQQNPAPSGTPAAEGTAQSAAAAKAQVAAEKAKKALNNLKSLKALTDAKELLADLLDPDRRTRRMARYFVLSVVGIVGVLIATGVYVSHVRLEKQLASGLTDTGEQGKNLGEFIKKQAEEAKRKFSTQSLGSFTIGLKSPEGAPAKRPPGVMNLAELEIVVECDEKETCEFIEDRMPAVRNELTNLFTTLDREQLLSREGKRKLKERIISKLNDWLPKGKIQNLYFNKLVIS